ncbi:Hypothetical protein CINCED_3A000885, partial [Cinara cedri]
MCTLPRPVFCHSTIVTPSDRMCCYGSYVEYDPVNLNVQCSNNIATVWITIPKLKIISWEAIVHYFKKEMFESSIENLKKIGIPPEFYNRIIEA